MRSELLVIKTTKEFKQRVRKAADQDNKTLSGYVRDCILEDFKKKAKNGTDKKDN